MNKKTSLAVAVATIIIAISILVVSPNEASLTCVGCEGCGVVDKAQGENFTVKVTFKNVGKTEDTWAVNVAFEGEEWSWSGTAQTLSLKPGHKKTLTWNGNVPSDAPIDTVARLIVYHDDSFAPQDWWIHVAEGAELAITSSTVE
jgi:hypothetical protein